jgi:hypothetical protein
MCKLFASDRLASLKIANDRSASLVSPPRPIVDPAHTGQQLKTSPGHRRRVTNTARFDALRSEAG